MNHTEAVLQASCVSWFNLQYPNLLIYSIPNGGKRRFLTAVRDKRMGLLPGMPDLAIPLKNDDYFGLFIELKAKGEFLKEEQVKRRSFLLKQGYAVVVVWSFEEFCKLVNDYAHDHPDEIEENVRVVDERIAKLEEKRAARRTKIKRPVKRRCV